GATIGDKLIPVVPIDPVMLVSFNVEPQACVRRPPAKFKSDLSFFLRAGPQVKGQGSRAITDVNRSLLVRHRQFARQLDQAVADITGQVMNDLWDPGVLSINVIEVFGLDQRVDAINLVFVDKGKPFVTVMIFILKESDLVTGCAFAEVTNKFFVYRKGSVAED